MAERKNDLPNRREEVLMRILVRERYGREIRDSYEKVTGESLPLGSLYTTLERMLEKGFLKAPREGESAPGRGGRPRKYFQISASGISALNRLAEVRHSAGLEVEHA